MCLKKNIIRKSRCLIILHTLLCLVLYTFRILKNYVEKTVNFFFFPPLCVRGCSFVGVFAQVCRGPETLWLVLRRMQLKGGENVWTPCCATLLRIS